MIIFPYGNCSLALEFDVLMFCADADKDLGKVVMSAIEEVDIFFFDQGMGGEQDVAEYHDMPIDLLKDSPDINYLFSKYYKDCIDVLVARLVLSGLTHRQVCALIADACSLLDEWRV